jgi:hypothetical protein
LTNKHPVRLDKVALALRANLLVTLDAGDNRSFLIADIYGVMGTGMNNSVSQRFLVL